MNQQDELFLLQVIELARSGVGKTAPNPSVGCLITQQTHYSTNSSTSDEIIAYARTGNQGIPHAETLALAQAAGNTHGATLYCSLEPCCHQGKTPPCVQAIIHSGIRKVVIGTLDPDPRVSGGGIVYLQNAGIEVEVAEGDINEKARFIIKGFSHRLSFSRPYTTLKLAISLDGKIALKNGESKWITSLEQRKQGHRVRYRNDAILVGIGTILADNPLLNCRIEEEISQEYSNLSLYTHLSSNEKISADHFIVRVVIDTELKLPLTSQIVRTAKQYKTIVFFNENLAITKHKDLINYKLSLERSGILVEDCPLIDLADSSLSKSQIDRKEGLARPKLSLEYVVHTLAHKYGINDLLVEGGANIATSMIKEKLIDHIICFQAPILLGNDALAGIGDLGLTSLTEAIFVKQVL